MRYGKKIVQLASVQVDGETLKLNGKNTQGENIADNGASRKHSGAKISSYHSTKITNSGLTTDLLKKMDKN